MRVICVCVCVCVRVLTCGNRYSPGQCGPNGETVGCRSQCIEKADPACSNLDCGRSGGICNNVKCWSEVEACAELRVPCAPTSPAPPPTPAGPCSACSNFGPPNSEKWCNCCKNDCFGSLQACKDNDGWCSSKYAAHTCCSRCCLLVRCRCMQYDGLCPAETPATTTTTTTIATTTTTKPTTPVPTTNQPTPQAYVCLFFSSV